MYLHGGGDRVLWGFGRLSKLGKQNARPTKCEKQKGGALNQQEPPKIAAAQPVILCHIPTPNRRHVTHYVSVAASFVKTA